MSIHCYTPTTVSNHKTTSDAWISIHGNVYDITNFITVVSTGIIILIINYTRILFIKTEVAKLYNILLDSLVGRHC